MLFPSGSAMHRQRTLWPTEDAKPLPNNIFNNLPGSMLWVWQVLESVL